jgi:hypothetical protein
MPVCKSCGRDHSDAQVGAPMPFVRPGALRATQTTASTPSAAASTRARWVPKYFVGRSQLGSLGLFEGRIAEQYNTGAFGPLPVNINNSLGGAWVALDETPIAGAGPTMAFVGTRLAYVAFYAITSGQGGVLGLVVALDPFATTGVKVGDTVRTDARTFRSDL